MLLGQERYQDIHCALRVPLRPSLVVEFAHILGMVGQPAVCAKTYIRNDVELVHGEPIDEVLATLDNHFDRFGGSGLHRISKLE
jgi:hypothetical protein